MTLRFSCRLKDNAPAVRQLCVAFDLDDTLYLERDYVRSGFRALEPWVKAHLGLDDFSGKAWAHFEQRKRGHIFDAVLSQAGLRFDQGTIQTMVDLYRGHKPDIHLAVDAAECLQALRHQVYLALVTDGPERSQQNKIDALGLQRIFETTILTSTLGSGCAKPNVQAFLAVQKRGDPAVREYVYVADNPAKDFIGPRRLGWKTVRVRRGQGLYSSVEPPEADYAADVEIHNLSLLIHFISMKNHHANSQG